MFLSCDGLVTSISDDRRPAAALSEHLALICVDRSDGVSLPIHWLPKSSQPKEHGGCADHGEDRITNPWLNFHLEVANSWQREGRGKRGKPLYDPRESDNKRAPDNLREDQQAHCPLFN